MNHPGPPLPPADGHATPPAAHDAWREQLGAYALGHLEDAERTAVEAHLEGCPDCREELTSLEILVAPLARVDPDALGPASAPPPDLEGRIRERVRGRDTGGPRRRRWALTAAAAGLVVVAAAAGLALGRALGPDAPPIEPVAAVAVPAVQADVGVIAHAWGVEVHLVGRGFAEGAPFRASITDRSGRVVDAGSFVGTGTDEMECHLTARILRPDATRVAVVDAAGREVVAAPLP